jgi:hypothetical protein
MRRTFKLPQIGIAVVVCALVGALAGIAGSAAAPSKSSTHKKSGTQPRMFRFGTRGAPPHPGFMGAGGPPVHAEAVVPNKNNTGFVTVTTDGGTVKSVSGNDITIDESVGSNHYKDATVTIPSGATVIRNHAKAAVSDIKAGDEIHVIASSEQTIVLAEDPAFEAKQRKFFQQHGPWEHGTRRGGHPAFGPPPGPPSGAPQGSGSTY